MSAKEYLIINIQEDCAKYWCENKLKIEHGKLFNTTFKVTVSSEKIHELQYLILLLQSIQKFPAFNYKVHLKHELKSGKEENDKLKEDDMFRIFAFLSFFQDGLNKNIFTLEAKNEYRFSKNITKHHISLRSIDTLTVGHLIPLIPIRKKTYEFFGKTVGDEFPRNFDCLNTKNKEDKNVHLIYHLCYRYLFDDMQHISESNAFQNYLAERRAHYQSPKFYDDIKDINILSFLIFCMQNHWYIREAMEDIRKNKTGSKAVFNKRALAEKGLSFESINEQEKKDRNLLLSSMDMADGLMQLIENIIFHVGDKNDNGRGLMRLRLYRRKSNTWSKYIEDNYPHYFAGYDNRYDDKFGQDISSLDICNSLEKKNIADIELGKLDMLKEIKKDIKKRKKERNIVEHYLEVQLLDNSEKNMYRTFLEQHDSFDSIRDQFNVSTFFNPTIEAANCWKNFVDKGGVNVVKHYGLQLFDALIKSLDGCFITQSTANSTTLDEKDFYTTSGDKPSSKNTKFHFSGTQYTILLPFTERKVDEKGFTNVAINYDISKTNFIGRHVTHKDIDDILSKPPTSQADKLNKIEELANSFAVKSYAENDVITIDIVKLRVIPTCYEILAKGLFLFISSRKIRKTNIALTNCNDNAFIHLIRSFAVLYDRKGQNNFLKHSQIYLLNNDTHTSFLLAGSNIKNAVVAQLKQEAHNRNTSNVDSIVSLLKEMISLRPGKGEAGTTIEYVPFNLLLKLKKSDTELSVFEHGVLKILETDLQKPDLGCLLRTHMRLGSSVHTNLFYEAVLLFSKSDYIRGFAWLLQQQIKNGKEDISTEDSPFLFVGYGVYSEMLLRELTKYFLHATYCLYDHGITNTKGKSSKEGFSHVLVKSKLKYRPIFIVPIVSTLSTFDKLHSSFDAELVISKKVDIDESFDKSYLSVVQTRHGRRNEEVRAEEREYFKNVDIESRTITSIILASETHYLFSVQQDWESPLKCKMCYPPRFFEEKPLIETDKTSVIPSQLFGEKKEKGEITYLTKPLNSQNLAETINLLNEDLLFFGHRERNGNHFEYYIRTEDLFEKRQDQVAIWLTKLQESIYPQNRESTSKIRFDFIVCPEHYSNKGFVLLVNDKVFNGAASIISVDVKKEFKDNFRTKHSDIRAFYKDLAEQGREMEMNFHYADDRIVHGKTFLRAKNLVQSLFTSNKNSKVKIHLFHSIILLSDRNSRSSRLKFIDNVDSYHAFLHLDISSQRNHADACALCFEKLEMKRIYKSASHNDVSTHFKTVNDNLKVKQINRNEIQKNIPEEDIRNKRAFKRMIATHKINRALSTLEDKNDTGQVFHKLCKLINHALLDENGDIIEYLIAYICACSRPFISYRKSAREAALLLIILCLETLLTCKLKIDIENMLNDVSIDCESSASSPESKMLFWTVKKLSKIDSNKRDLIKALMKQSVMLKSSYIVRKANMPKIYASLKSVHRKNDASFCKYYIYCIKRLLVGGKDDAKSLFLEHLLLSGDETIDKLHEGKINDQVYRDFHLFDENFRQALYLENTQIFLDATNDFSKKKRTDVANAYYLKDYKQMLEWNGDDYNKISPALLEVHEKIALKAKESDDPISIFNNISKSFETLLKASINDEATTIDVIFLSKRKDDVLCWDENTGIVATRDTYEWNHFAGNEENFLEETLDTLKAKLKNLHDTPLPSELLVLNTYSMEKDFFVIQLEESKQESESNRHIHLAVKFSRGLDERQCLKALRYILVFRSYLTRLVARSFDRQLDEHLAGKQKEREFKKMRAIAHANDENYTSDLTDPTQYPNEKFIRNRGCKNQQLYANRSAYKQYLNALIGRINILLIGKTKDRKIEWGIKNDNPKFTNEELISILCKALSSIGFLTRWETLYFPEISELDTRNTKGDCARSILMKEFNKLFEGKILRKNSDSGLYIPFRYVVAFVTDILNTVAGDAVKAGTERKIDIYLSAPKDSFVIKYKIPSYKKSSIGVNIKAALERKSKGISLATICGFFDSFFNDQQAKVKIILTDEYCEIHLPFFIRREQNENTND